VNYKTNGSRRKGINITKYNQSTKFVTKIQEFQDLPKTPQLKRCLSVSFNNLWILLFTKFIKASFIAVFSISLA